MRLKRRIPEVNSSSSADVAFLLLVFFLLASSPDKEKTLLQQLPEKKETPDKPRDIKERDVFKIALLADNSLIYEEERITREELKGLAKLFITNPEDNMYLPEKFPEEIPFFGEYHVTRNHIFILEVSREASYQSYIDVQNEIIAAYNEARNDLSRARWKKEYILLSPEERKAIQQIYPYKIAEKEIEEEEGGKA
ncbi:MAG: biopolymer transporter ExbD [Candidatus Azobacteroides sp.]|nr:biopolymer transporter ExbD [Candidatus Azobacteroides sp.]